MVESPHKHGYHYNRSYRGNNPNGGLVTIE